jgi:hypothetical protein
MDGKCTDRRVPHVVAVHLDGNGRPPNSVRVVAVHLDGDDGVRRLERPESRVRG